MQQQDIHPSDQELLLAVDGELTAGEAARVESHLAACWACRARRQEMESAIGDFVRMHRRDLDAQIPSAEGPRALLRAQLTQLAATQKASVWAFSWFRSWRLAWQVAAAVCGLAAISYLISISWTSRQADLGAVSVPNPSLTPGATVLVSRGEVCHESNTKNKVVPVSLRKQVFDEYGIRTAKPNAYEVDYLITPALGGADDIHNLWPQSYTATVWNAQVKDALEDHLRDMVCDGQLDLATAQREIAVNWIDAYKKYFHTDRPLTSFR
jgi:Putative zinc-finger